MLRERREARQVECLTGGVDPAASNASRTQWLSSVVFRQFGAPWALTVAVGLTAVQAAICRYLHPTSIVVCPTIGEDYPRSDVP